MTTWRLPSHNGRRYSSPARIPTIKAPTISGATVLGTSSVSIAFSGGNGFTSLVPQFRTAGSGSWTDKTGIATNSTSYTFTGLSANTAYEFRLKVLKDDKVMYSSTVTRTTSAEATPVAPTLGTPSFSGRTVSITFSGGSNYSTLIPQYSLNGVSGWTNMPNDTTSPFAFTLPDYDTTYYFRALANGNASYASNVVSGTTGEELETPEGEGTGYVTPTSLSDRPLAEPVLFQPFTDTETGDSPVDAGWDDWVDHGTGRVSMSVGPFANSGCLYVDQEITNNAMPHFSKYLPANSDSIFANFMFRAFRVGNPTQVFPQIKLTRSAPIVSGDPGVDYAQNNSKYYTSIWFDPTDGGSAQNNIASWNDANGADHHSYWESTNYGGISRTVENNFITHWNNIEVFHGMNTPGVANGVLTVSIDNEIIQHRPQCQPRNSLSTHFGFTQLIPGLDVAYEESMGVAEHVFWRWAIGRAYIDVNTKAHICRINAPTLAAATGKFMLKPVAPFDGDEWYYDHDINAPDGYDWICCVDSAGNSHVTHRPL